MCNFDNICLPIILLITHLHSVFTIYKCIIYYDATVSYIVTIKLPTIIYTYLFYIIGRYTYLVKTLYTHLLNRCCKGRFKKNIYRKN